MARRAVDAGGNAGEAVNLIDAHRGGRVDPAVRQVQHSAAADCGQLPPVTDERDASTGLIGNRQQRAGGVLVEHGRLVDEQSIPTAPRRDLQIMQNRARSHQVDRCVELIPSVVSRTTQGTAALTTSLRLEDALFACPGERLVPARGVQLRVQPFGV